MSYINDALRKAQRERDGRYGRFGGIITSGPERPGQPRKRRIAIGVAVLLLVLIPAGLLIAVYVLQQPSPVKKGPVPRLAAVNSAVSPSVTPPAAGEAAPGGDRFRSRAGLGQKRRRPRRG